MEGNNRAMHGEASTRRATPLGVILVSILLGVYGLLWLVTWLFERAAGNGLVATLSLLVAIAVLLVAYLLARGSAVAWWVATITLGASTVWRLSLVVAGAPGNLVNAVVGIGLVLYLLARRDFYQ